jgi:hypoxanthine-guanine phosphoribosyltransferase
MSFQRGEVFRGILIGSGVFICSLILLITIYLLYRYRRESFYFRQNLNDDQQFKINKRDEEIIDPTSTVIQDLMRKSLELAKTAEKVADDKEKRITLKDKINLDLQS